MAVATRLTSRVHGQQRPAGPARAALVRLSTALVLVLFCLATLPSSADAALFSPNSKVVQLNRANFKRQVLDIEKPTMVSFTAPWCGHCQRLVPEYEKVAKQLDGIVKIANIDCDADENKSTCAQYGIQGFPTLKLFPPTKKRLPRDYQAARTAKDIAAYVIDALPMGAKKLRAEELLSYCEKEPEVPKLLLFSTKPTSSPLYKSLALDFRNSISFAFLRGDQASVRAASRAHLGISMDEKDLPLLVAVPSREEGTKLVEADLKKYQGQLKYHDLHKWILDTIPEAKSKKGSSSKATPKAKPKAKPKPKSKPKSKPAVQKAKASSNADHDDDDDADKLPKGAQYEWKAENEPDSAERREKLKDIADMLNEAARRARDGAAQKVSDASDTIGEAYEGVKQKVFDSSADRAEYQGSEPGESGSRSAREASQGSGDETHTSHSSSWSSASSYSSSTDGDGQTTEDTEAEYRSSSSDDPQEHSYRVASHRTSASGDERESLKESLTRWLDGQEVDWQSKYSSEFEKASEAAAKLLSEDPETAREVVVKGEEFLLSHLRTDLAMMLAAREAGNTDKRIDDGNVERVEKMVRELEKRIEQREDERVRHEEL